MSTVVAVRKGLRVCIAADTLTTHGELRQSADYEQGCNKIIGDGENFIGIVGSAAHNLVIDNILHDRGFEYDLGSREAIYDSFRRMHGLLKDEHYLNPREENDDPYESSRIDALIINPYGIFGVYALREVFEYKKFWAIGAGGDFALGAMFDAYDREEEAESIAKVGIEAGVEFTVSSSLPMTIHSCDLE